MGKGLNDTERMAVQERRTSTWLEDSDAINER